MEDPTISVGDAQLPADANVADDSLPTNVKPGDILAGKYRVNKVLGAGGMGVVVQATHIVLEDKVALKFLLPEFVENEAVSARFLREAQAAVRIKSPNVARVVDVGTLESGAPFMVMEYLSGRDLGQELDAIGPFSVETAAKFALQACEALASAHASGIIHRDIKPANLFITQNADGSPLLKVLDFGISKVADATGVSNLTRTHAAMGSPTYMSPEQMRSAKDVDSRADIWSLGVVIFEMVAGTLPFNAESMPQLVALVLESEAPSLRDARPDVDEAFDELVTRCLQKDTSKRFQDVAELASALAPFAGETGYESARRIHRILNAGSSELLDKSTTDPKAKDTTRKATNPRIASSTSTSFERTYPSAPQNRIAIFAALGGGVAVICFAAIWFATQGLRSDVPVSAAQPPVIPSESSAAQTVEASTPMASAPVVAAPSASAPVAAETAEAGSTTDIKRPIQARPTKKPAAQKGSVFDDRK